MKCKDDNTCDQPATKGELEKVRDTLLVMSIFSMCFLGFLMVKIEETR